MARHPATALLLALALALALHAVTAAPLGARRLLSGPTSGCELYPLFLKNVSSALDYFRSPVDFLSWNAPCVPETIQQDYQLNIAKLDKFMQTTFVPKINSAAQRIREGVVASRDTLSALLDSISTGDPDKMRDASQSAVETYKTLGISTLSELLYPLIDLFQHTVDGFSLPVNDMIRTAWFGEASWHPRNTTLFPLDKCNFTTCLYKECLGVVPGNATLEARWSRVVTLGRALVSDVMDTAFLCPTEGIFEKAVSVRLDDPEFCVQQPQQCVRLLTDSYFIHGLKSSILSHAVVLEQLAYLV